MQKEQYKLMFEQEKGHWWYIGNRIIAFSLISRYLNRRKNLKILDAGCGTGINMLKLSRYGKVYGIDASSEALKFCRFNGIKNTKKASVENIPFKNDSFDVITSFEVLYHKDVLNYENALNEFNRILKKNGILVLRLPAFNFLFGSHDLAVHGIRRFTKPQLRKSLLKAGFKIERITYINSISFIPVLLLRNFQRILGMKKIKADTSIKPGIFNKILIKWFVLESKVLRHFDIPFGVSVLCIAKKV